MFKHMWTWIVMAICGITAILQEVTIGGIVLEKTRTVMVFVTQHT